MGFLFGQSSSPGKPPPMAMPPTTADPLLWSLGQGKRKASLNQNPGLAPLTKPVTTTQTSLLGG